MTTENNNQSKLTRVAIKALVWLTRIVLMLMWIGVFAIFIRHFQSCQSHTATLESAGNLLQAALFIGAFASGLQSTMVVLTAPAPKFRYGTAGIISSFGFIWLAFSGKQFMTQSFFEFRAPVHLLIGPLCLIILAFVIHFHAWYTFKYRMKTANTPQQPQSQP